MCKKRIIIFFFQLMEIKKKCRCACGAKRTKALMWLVKNRAHQERISLAVADEKRIAYC